MYYYNYHYNSLTVVSWKYSELKIQSDSQTVGLSSQPVECGEDQTEQGGSDWSQSCHKIREPGWRAAPGLQCVSTHLHLHQSCDCQTV